jgi:hypothetical protein
VRRITISPRPAPHAGGHLRQRAKPGRSDGLFALLAQAVLAAAEPLQGLCQLIGAPDEQAASGKAHLAVLVLADDVDLISQGGIVADRSRELFKNHGAAHLADSIHRVIQFRLEPFLDLFHGLSLLSRDLFTPTRRSTRDATLMPELPL